MLWNITLLYGDLVLEKAESNYKSALFFEDAMDFLEENLYIQIT